MPRRRGQSKSQSVSSAVGSPVSPSPPSPKAATPARKPRRTSAASPPASPTSATAPMRRHRSQASPVLRFPLVAILSFGISSLLFSLIAQVTSGEVAAVSKHPESWNQITAFLGWKVVELGIYWFGGFDAFDVASLAILLSAPYTLLLALFFQIQPTTLCLNALANLIAVTTPFILFRPLSPPHHPHSAPRNLVRNKSILTDPYTTLSTSLLATAIFAVLLEVSFATFLPTFLITHFSQLRTLNYAHRGAAGLLTLLVALVPTGLACTTFLFLPSAGVVKSYMQASTFDPVTSTFRQHVYHNAWGWYSARQRELIKRTVVAGVMVAAETVVQVWGTIEGVELIGAGGYAGLFAAGVALVGMVYEWVGGPSG